MINSKSTPDAVYTELVRSLLLNPIPPVIMSGLFALSFWVLSQDHADTQLIVFGWLGVATSIVRLSIMFYLRSRALPGAIQFTARVRPIERVFAVSYIAFSVSLGLFGGRVLALPDTPAHMLTLVLLTGYCAGVASGTGLRPTIAIPSMAIAIGPATVSAALYGQPIYVTTAVVIAFLLLGGSHALRLRARLAMQGIGQRIDFESLARLDVLTGLPNRLALREHFAAHCAEPASIAVHYIDLDEFKPVNDTFGHAAGDALLRAVAGRLANVVRSSDIAARLGGDEFVVLQCDLTDSAEADALVERLAASLTRPYRIADHTIKISASIGSAFSDKPGGNLDDLMARADEALYKLKGERRKPRRAANRR